MNFSRVVCLAVFMLTWGCSGSPEQGASEQASIRFRLLVDSAEASAAGSRFPEAQAYLQSAKDLASEGAQLSAADRIIYYRVLSELAFNLGEYSVPIDVYASIVDFERGHELDDRGAEMRFAGGLWIAHALKKAGDTSMALLWYKRILPVTHPASQRDILNNIAGLSYAQGEYDAALRYLDSARRSAVPGWEHDHSGRAWDWFVRARCYLHMHRYADASRVIDSGVTILERYRFGRNASEVDVRLSVIRTVMDDPVTVHPSLRSYRRRLSTLRTDDSLRQEQLKGSTAQQSRTAQMLRALLWLPGESRYREGQLDLEQPWITGAATDRRGWRWLSTLSGLCLQIGSTMIPVDDGGRVTSSIALRGISIKDDTLRLRTYTGQERTVQLHDLVNRTTQPHAAYRVLPSWQWVAFDEQAPSALIMGPTTDSTLWCYRDSVGWGTATTAPDMLAPIRMTDGQRWRGVIRCGLAMSDTHYLLGTGKGLWSYDRTVGVAARIVTTPAYLSEERIESMTTFADSTLILFPAYGAPVQFRIDPDGEINWTSGRRVEQLSALPWNQGRVTPIEFKRLRDATTPPIGRAVQLTSEQALQLQDRSATRGVACVSSDLIVYPQIELLQVLDLRRNRLDIHEIPRGMYRDSYDQRVQFVTADRTAAVLYDDGLLLVSLSDTAEADGSSIIATRTPAQESFSVHADAASIALAPAERSAEILIGRPPAYGAYSVAFSVTVPWSGRVRYEESGRPIAITVPGPGEHQLTFTASDLTGAAIVNISAAPAVTETWWFWGLAVVFLGAVVVGGVRYIYLLRQRRLLLSQQAVLEERVQIGRDLHDALGADLVRISMSAKRLGESPQATDIARTTADASRTLRDIIWSVADTHTVDALIATMMERLRNTTEEAGLSFVADVPLDLPLEPIESQRARDIMLIAVEAVTNVVRHAQATQIRYEVRHEVGATKVTIEDDGVGLSRSESDHLGTGGYGLRNMRERAARSGLDLSIVALERGTNVCITIPV